jgi:hypothetical protein
MRSDQAFGWHCRVVLDGQMVRKAVKHDAAFDPLDAGLLGAVGVVLEPERIPDLIEQLGCACFHGLMPRKWVLTIARHGYRITVET